MREREKERERERERERENHYIAQAALELTMYPRLALNTEFSCLSLLDAWIVGCTTIPSSCDF
jgi:predicted chitinase